MRHALIAGLVLLAGCATGPAAQPRLGEARVARPAAVLPPSGGEWIEAGLADKPEGVTITRGNISVHLAEVATADDGRDVVATVRLGAMEPVRLRVIAGPSYIPVMVGFGRLSPADPMPSVIVQSHSGGPHCCIELAVAAPVGGRLQAVQLPMYDGYGYDEFPTDEDGDGTVDFAFQDDRFLYAFTSYMGSWPPPQFLNIVDGKLVDVSARPGFAPYFRSFARDALAECADQSNDGRNGACAGYVAASARLGRFEEALAEAIKYANADETGSGQCLDEECNEVLEFKTFEEALRWFLKDAGYIE